MRKSLFNFYLDDKLKNDVQDKIVRLLGDKPKGQVSALIRTLLKLFISIPDNEIDPLLLKELENEYEYNLKSNKRSNI
jgi:hypothetical protein